MYVIGSYSRVSAKKRAANLIQILGFSPSTLFCSNVNMCCKGNQCFLKRNGDNPSKVEKFELQQVIWWAFSHFDHLGLNPI